MNLYNDVLINDVSILHCTENVSGIRSGVSQSLGNPPVTKTIENQDF
jgi:hypothetical protein